MFPVLTSSKGISLVVMGRLPGVNQKTAWKMVDCPPFRPDSPA